MNDKNIERIEVIQSRHNLSYCSSCETDMVICADCGNNCCGGGTNKVDGKFCGCKEAYDHQSVYWQNNSNIKFAKDIREQKASFSIHEVACDGDVRLLLDVGGHKGNVWLSPKIWESIGKHAGWIKENE